MDQRKSLKSILLIESEAQNKELIREAVSSYFNSAFALEIFEDPNDALEHLSKNNDEAFKVVPYFILMRIEPGDQVKLDVLRYIKKNPYLKNYPVVAYSTSKDPEFVNHCYDLHVNSFFKRSKTDEKFSKSVTSLLNFWFTVVIPPVPGKEY